MFTSRKKPDTWSDIKNWSDWSSVCKSKLSKVTDHFIAVTQRCHSTGRRPDVDEENLTSQLNAAPEYKAMRVEMNTDN